MPAPARRLSATAIRPFGPGDAVPWTLLLAADGPRREILGYLGRGELWLAERAGRVVGQWC